MSMGWGVTAEGGSWDVTSGQQGEGNGLTNQVIHGSGQDLLVYFLFFQAQDDIIRRVPVS